jgi:hypothetical protein
METSKRETLRLEARALWIKALKYDGIPLDAKFVVLSAGNPYDGPYNEAMERYMAESLKYNSVAL